MSFISHAQNFEDVMLWRALKHVQNGFYIDVGAQHPVVDSVSKAFYEHGWRGIHIEPVPFYAELLRKDRPDETVLQVALADAEGMLELNVISDTGLSTGVDAYAHRHQLERGYESQRIQVQALTLGTATKSLLDKDVHWLKIDVEGFEEKVLKGWDSTTLRPWIMVVEATVPNLSKTDYENWEPILIAADYQFVYFDGLNRFYVAKEHAELVEAFSCPPNVFDNIELTGNSILCHGLMESHQASEKGLAAQAEELTIELEAANEHNTQLQSHAEWLQSELDAVSAKVHELSQSSQHWQAVADRLNQEQQSIYASKFWRITWPLRKIMQITNRSLALLSTMSLAIRLPKLMVKPLMLWAMRKILNNSGIRSRALSTLAKYPRLKQHLRLFAMRSGLIAGGGMASTAHHLSGSRSTAATVYSLNMQEEPINHLSRRAARIYNNLKKTIEVSRKN